MGPEEIELARPKNPMGAWSGPGCTTGLNRAVGTLRDDFR